MACRVNLASRLLEATESKSRPPNTIERLAVTSFHAGEQLFF
jgi:hypothetical protein